MVFDALAGLVVVTHVAFLVFVGVGALLVSRAPRLVWLHLPLVAWSAGSLAVGFECPLTGLEKRLREAGGDVPYRGGFVDHYVEDVIYPDELTPLLWALAAAITALGYGRLVVRSGAARRCRRSASGAHRPARPAAER